MVKRKIGPAGKLAPPPKKAKTGPQGKPTAKTVTKDGAQKPTKDGTAQVKNTTNVGTPGNKAKGAGDGNTADGSQGPATSAAVTDSQLDYTKFFKDDPDCVPSEGFLATIRTPTLDNSQEPFGYPNAAVSCYRNAVMTALMHSEYFVSYLQNWHMEHETPEEDAFPAGWKGRKQSVVRLLRLLDEMASAAWRKRRLKSSITASIDKFWKGATANSDNLPARDGRVQWKGWNTNNTTQEDAGEFLTWTLSHIGGQLKADLNYEEKDDAADDALTQEFENFNCLLQIRLSSFRKCLACAATQAKGGKAKGKGQPKPRIRLSKRLDKQNLWVLQIPDKPKDKKQAHELADCVDTTCDDSLSMTCNVCKTKNAATEVRWRIFAMPEILLIQINRIKADATKNFDAVRIPEELDLSQWLNQYKFPDGTKIVYQLRAVISHIGDDVTYGHYIAYIRRTETDKNGKDTSTWWKINDHQVEKSTFETATRADAKITARPSKAAKSRPTPFILLYEKIEDTSQTAEDLEPPKTPTPPPPATALADPPAVSRRAPTKTMPPKKAPATNGQPPPPSTPSPPAAPSAATPVQTAPLDDKASLPSGIYKEMSNLASDEEPVPEADDPVGEVLVRLRMGDTVMTAKLGQIVKFDASQPFEFELDAFLRLRQSGAGSDRYVDLVRAAQGGDRVLRKPEPGNKQQPVAAVRSLVGLKLPAEAASQAGKTGNKADNGKRKMDGHDDEPAQDGSGKAADSGGTAGAGQADPDSWVVTGYKRYKAARASFKRGGPLGERGGGYSEETLNNLRYLFEDPGDDHFNQFLPDFATKKDKE